MTAVNKEPLPEKTGWGFLTIECLKIVNGVGQFSLYLEGRLPCQASSIRARMPARSMGRGLL